MLFKKKEYQQNVLLVLNVKNRKKENNPKDKLLRSNINEFE